MNLRAKGPELKIGNDYDFVNYIENRIIKDRLSRCAVLGKIKLKKVLFKTSICKNALYSYIEKGIFPNLEIKHLIMKYKTKKKN